MGLLLSAPQTGGGVGWRSYLPLGLGRRRGRGLVLGLGEARVVGQVQRGRPGRAGLGGRVRIGLGLTHTHRTLDRAGNEGIKRGQDRYTEQKGKCRRR